MAISGIVWGSIINITINEYGGNVFDVVTIEIPRVKGNGEYDPQYLTLRDKGEILKTLYQSKIDSDKPPIFIIPYVGSYTKTIQSYCQLELDETRAIFTVKTTENAVQLRTACYYNSKATVSTTVQSIGQRKNKETQVLEEDMYLGKPNDKNIRYGNITVCTDDGRFRLSIAITGEFSDEDAFEEARMMAKGLVGKHITLHDTFSQQRYEKNDGSGFSYNMLSVYVANGSSIFATAINPVQGLAAASTTKSQVVSSENFKTGFSTETTGSGNPQLSTPALSPDDKLPQHTEQQAPSAPGTENLMTIPSDFTETSTDHLSNNPDSDDEAGIWDKSPTDIV